MRFGQGTLSAFAIAVALTAPVTGCAVDEVDTKPKPEGATPATAPPASADVACSSNEVCGPGALCGLSHGVCGGEGLCITAPVSCDGVGANDVCGCDGVTYANGCEAARHGTSLAHEGPCPTPSPEPPPPVPTCGGTLCGAGEFCDVPDGSCGASGMDGGSCVATSAVCTAPAVPACGCDGQTYDTVCEMRKAGVSIWHTGPCSAV